MVIWLEIWYGEPISFAGSDFFFTLIFDPRFFLMQYLASLTNVFPGRAAAA